LRRRGLEKLKIDWLTIFLYAILVFAGWLNIYAAVYDVEAGKSIFDLSLNSGKQLVWIGMAVIPIILIMVMDFRFYDSFAYVNYAVVALLLIAAMLFAREVNGARAWLELGPIKFQPSELAKCITALALAKFLSNPTVKLDKTENLLKAAAILGFPVLLILLQNDTGTATVFFALIIVLYREGMNPSLIIIGLVAAFIFILTLLFPQVYLYAAIGATALLVIALGKKTVQRIMIVAASAAVLCGTVYSVDFLLTEVLQPHQQNRIKALINPSADPLGYGWNVTQSKIAIGSGGFIGKGFLEGTQTKFDFVPEQSTDFIFCTIGEEHGWLGSLFVIVVYMALLFRIIVLSERQKSRFARVYGYSVAAILFYHFVVNIGMTIGLFPVMGIPLPFFSYGGSSLWSFTVLLFILIKLDAHRMDILVRT
jgi:rod shape determining protein RodA